MTNQKIKISVIIPVFNVENFLEDCLNSVINQSLKELEIICINDGSSDSSLEILEKFAKIDSRITVINQENKGQGAARNVGIKLAKGEFIGFIDSDDWIDLDFYEKLYDAAVRWDADIACASMIRKRKHHQKYRVNYKKEQVTDDINEKINLCNSPRQLYTPNKIYKKSKLVDEFNLLFPEGVVYEDIVFLIQCLYYLNRLVVVPNTHYWYRVNMNSTVKKKQTKKMIEEKKNALCKYAEFLKQNNVRVPENDLICSKDKIKILGITLLAKRYWLEYYRFYLFDLFPISKRINTL